MRCEGFPLESYSFFALGNLPVEEAMEIRAHLDAGCEVCRKEVERSEGVWTAIALSATPREPSRVLRQRVRAMVQPEKTGWLPRAWASPWAQGLLAASLAAGAFVIGRTGAPNHPEVQVRTVTVPGSPDTSALHALEQDNQRLREQARSVSAPVVASAPSADSELQALRSQLAQASQDTAKLHADLATAQGALQEANRKYMAASEAVSTPANPVPNTDDARRQTAAIQARAQELERQVSEYKALLAAEHRKLEGSLQVAALLNSPDLKLVRLRPTEKTGGVEGHAFVTAGSQVYFYASQLPALPAGRVYQLWLIRSQSPAIVSAGTFAPDARSRAALQFANGSLTSGITGIAVTDEPAGGSEKPTGHKLLIGS